MGNKDQVLLKLEGGLGNQLFQFAAGYFLAAKISGNLTIDQYSIPLTTVHGELEYGFGELHFDPLPGGNQIYISRKLPSKLAIKLVLKKPSIKRLLLKVRMITSNPEKLTLFIEENNLSSKKNFLGIIDSVKLHGNFQSWDIVERAAEFGFPRILKLRIIPDWIKTLDIDFNDSVVLHLRLGDDTKINLKFKQPDMEYYLAATKILKSATKAQNIYVLSDDLERARNFLGIDFPYDVKFLNMPNNSIPLERMYFMSLFRGIVCANSTFCGWAAWSISNSGGAVIVPVPYSDGPVLGSRDFPVNWIQLNKYSGAEAV